MFHAPAHKALTNKPGQIVNIRAVERRTERRQQTVAWLPALDRRVFNRRK